MSSNWVFDIKKMQTKYGVHDWIKKATPFELQKYIRFRYDFLKEEMAETDDAIILEDAEEFVDGLIDICVVAIGTLDAIGVDPYKAWDTVLKANMTKEAGVKESRPNPLGIPDMIKPEGWEAPSHNDNHGLIPISYISEVELDASLDKMIEEKADAKEEIVKQKLKKPKKKAAPKKKKVPAKKAKTKKAKTETAKYTPGPGPLDGTQAKIDWTKDSEYIRLYGESDENNK